AVFVNKSHRLVRCGGLGAVAAAAVGAFNQNQRWLAQGWSFCSGYSHCLFSLHLDFEYRLSALNAIAAAQERFRNFLTVHEGAVSRTQVAQKTARRRNLQ